MKLLERPLELRKDISLAALFPNQLVALKTMRTAKIAIPEWIFDLDYPGQHKRIIDAVRVSIKTTPATDSHITCKLTLLYSKYRRQPTLTGYGRYNHEGLYKHLYGSSEQVATSRAMYDSGLFEFAFKETS